jgi:hypothetical protein
VGVGVRLGRGARLAEGGVDGRSSAREAAALCVAAALTLPGPLSEAMALMLLEPLGGGVAEGRASAREAAALCVAALAPLTLPGPLLVAMALTLPEPLSARLAEGGGVAECRAEGRTTAGEAAALCVAAALTLPGPLSVAMALKLPGPLTVTMALTLPEPMTVAMALMLPEPLTVAMALTLPEPLTVALAVMESKDSERHVSGARTSSSSSSSKCVPEPTRPLAGASGPLIPKKGMGGVAGARRCARDSPLKRPGTPIGVCPLPNYNLNFFFSHCRAPGLGVTPYSVTV